MSLYEHVPHPHLNRRRDDGPVRTDHHRFAGKGTFGKLNALVGLKITLLVGTMICAYLFAVIALISLPSAIRTHNLTIIVAWISSNFLQLVLLPIIIVGQNVQSKAADARSEQTYQDAEVILHECLELQNHLQAQDKLILAAEGKLAALTASAASWPVSKPAPAVRASRAKPKAS